MGENVYHITRCCLFAQREPYCFFHYKVINPHLNLDSLLCSCGLSGIALWWSKLSLTCHVIDINFISFTQEFKSFHHRNFDGNCKPWAFRSKKQHEWFDSFWHSFREYKPYFMLHVSRWVFVCSCIFHWNTKILLMMISATLFTFGKSIIWRVRFDHRFGVGFCTFPSRFLPISVTLLS